MSLHVISVLVLSSCSSDRTTTIAPPTTTATTTSAAPVPQRVARLGAAVSAERLAPAEPDAKLVARHFDSVTPENAMKWSTTRPSATTWNWVGADAIVEFAERSGLDVRGHTLVWGQPSGNGMPAWLKETLNPADFTAAVLDGIDTQVTRYRGRVQRWDVVNEPFEALSGELQKNAFFERMGPDYIEQALRAARAADPDAELWINENATEYLPAKADALVELVRGLKGRGVPLDGVGLQTHLFLDAPLPAGAIADLIGGLRELGVDVALTEVDVPGGSANRDPTAQQALWKQVADECVAAGCVELTTWGVTDASTWLDSPTVRAGIPFLESFTVPTRPLLFDESGQAKPAFDIIEEALTSR